MKTTLFTMKTAFFPVCLLLAVLALAGCDRRDSGYKKRLVVDLGPASQLTVDRYEDVLFNLDTTAFQEGLMAIQERFMPFLGGDLSDPQAVKYLKDFAVDTFSLLLYDKVRTAYPDNKGILDVVAGVYRHFDYHYPETLLPDKVYTCVSGIDPDIPSLIFFDDALVISLDWYLDNDEVYEWIGMPAYRAQRTSKASLAKDLGQQLYMGFVQQPHKRNNLLEEMVEAGRMDFFAEAMCPDLDDVALLGYTAQQLQWAEDFEGELWADIVGSQLLYAANTEVYRTFLADGPFTNEYSHEAPARLGEFIGLHIVRSFMNANPTVTMRELMEESDLQRIFQESKYKPKK